MPIFQAGMSILEGKISPFSNLKTIITVLDIYGLTQNMGLVTSDSCGSCFCRNWMPLPGDSQLLAIGSTIWSVTVHSSSVTDWLTYFRRNNLPQTNDSPLTQKWIFTCHLVMAGPSHKNQQLRMRVRFPLGGVPIFHCFCLLQEPQPQHPTWLLQMSPGARPKHEGALWSTILWKYSQPWSFSGGE